MLLEEHMACRMGVEPVLPRLWQTVGKHLKASPNASRRNDPFGEGLRPLYRLYSAARRLVARSGPVPGDLRPARCDAIDFNAGTVWHQPWERDLGRRFPR